MSAVSWNTADRDGTSCHPVLERLDFWRVFGSRALHNDGRLKFTRGMISTLLRASFRLQCGKYARGPEVLNLMRFLR